MFKCDCCGLCCMNLSNSDLYSDLDRGDGVCIYFNIDTKLCSIYDHRPTKCNIDKMYELFFKEKISIEEYYQMNYKACDMLKKQGGIKCI